jgi:hypothetical protein
MIIARHRSTLGNFLETVYMTTSVVLPLSLDSHRNFQSFFKALEDKTIQSSLLKGKDTDPAVKELVRLAQDKKFLKLAEKVVNQLREQAKAKTDWAGTFAATSANMKAAGPEKTVESALAIKKYVSTKYPAGLALLSEYGKLAQPMHVAVDESVAAWTDVAAYAEALVNAAVYANVAIATNVAVAAAVVAVIAVVVT